MNYTKLGRTGLSVSRLCLGTMNFGSKTTEQDSYAIMNSALAHGLNFFDSADFYGGHLGMGATEKIMGRWFSKDKERRNKVVLATKVYGPTGDWPNMSGLSALHIKQACEGSLRRLQTDYIDLYQMHHIDREVPWEEIWQAMEQLVQEGKILYVGSSNFAAWNIVQANEIAKNRNFLGIISEQSVYNLTNRTIELEVIPACQACGVGIMTYSPLAGGILGGVLRKTDNYNRRASDHIQKFVENHKIQLEKFENLCVELGHKPANVALSWLLHQPSVTCPIVGPRTLSQFEDSLNALSIQLSSDTLQRLDAIWPDLGGQAPEAYAW